MSGGSPGLAAQDVLDALSAATCAVRPDGVIVAVNDAWRAFADDNGGDAAACGVGVDYLAACEAVAGRDAPDAADVARGLRAVLTGAAATYRRTYAGHGPDVERWFTVRIAPLPTISGRGALVTHTDVTELHRTERALTHQAQHDGLTGLANRDLFGERLVEALAHGRHNATQVAVAFLDLDHFKRVNDSFGHANGDVLLVDVAARLRGAVREGDTLARYSGDEFVAVWRDLTSPEAVGPLGERLAQALDAPFEISGGSVRVGASIGIALAQPGQSAEEVLVAADAAMYDAKRRGRGRVRVFTSELRFGVQERMATELDLRAALGRSELVLHYQPSSTCRPVCPSPSKRSPVGSTRSAGCSNRTSSSRSPRTPGSSSRWGSGRCGRPARTPPMRADRSPAWTSQSTCPRSSSATRTSSPTSAGRSLSTGSTHGGCCSRSPSPRSSRTSRPPRWLSRSSWRSAYGSPSRTSAPAGARCCTCGDTPSAP